MSPQRAVLSLKATLAIYCDVRVRAAVRECNVHRRGSTRPKDGWIETGGGSAEDGPVAELGWFQKLLFFTRMIFNISTRHPAVSLCNATKINSTKAANRNGWVTLVNPLFSEKVGH